MIRFRTFASIAGAVLLSAGVAASPGYDAQVAHKSAWPSPAGSLSVMSYNIKGLPWPVAIGREAAIAAMGQRLAAMRSSGAQPHVVLLQEAFGDSANVLGETAGYKYVITGPQSSWSDDSEPLGRTFAEGAEWVKGEVSGSLINSGLAILSDYPVVRSERYAFPEGACAGYDCLAAKGVVVAWIDVPGADEPIAVINTHLNSRRSTHVATQRADSAYFWQVGAVRKLLSNVLPSGTPAIFGGDFNTGQSPARRVAVSQPLIDGTPVDGLKILLTDGGVAVGSRSEAQRIVERNKDKIIFRNGARVALRAERAWVPFPVTSEEPLSDHAGFVIDVSLIGGRTTNRGAEQP
ncbi:endonuclease/exonuclease/phosphatase family protein [Novosphingobium aquimarinum]|uniref:endonuclease/exonuclease/phosphatase family protein n=1 Tax=Novosphingobium aquimarinum TaxID=2682494 RepID=UPI0012EC6170|nr:endonuclease/exonuclease/phosphatase family protein [Novosphingobium aquimarinum]